MTVMDGVFQGTKMQELDKISESGTKWEFVDWFVTEFNVSNYPRKIDPSSSSYYVYFRAR